MKEKKSPKKGDSEKGEELKPTQKKEGEWLDQQPGHFCSGELLANGRREIIGPATPRYGVMQTLVNLPARIGGSA